MEPLELFTALHIRNVRYLLCGGLAVSVYGIPRMTADVDVVLDFTEENVRAFLAAVRSLQFESHLPLRLEELVDAPTRQRYIKERNLLAYSFFNSRKSTFALDILIQVPLSFEEMWAQHETRMVADVPIYLVSPAHLIRMKEEAGRRQDKEDVLLLSQLINRRSDESAS